MTMIERTKCPICRRSVLQIRTVKGVMLCDPDKVRCIFDNNRGAVQHTFGEGETVFPGIDPRDEETEQIYVAYRRHYCRRKK